MSQPLKFSRPLHAMRGIAALVVVFGHCFDTLVRIDTSYKPFSFIFNSAAAVTFFFVLSGLVLSLSIARSTLDINSYTRYVIRRVFRLLPLLWVTVAVGGAYLFIFDAYMPMSFATLGPLDVPRFIAGLIGFSLKPNPPSWSIFVELVISLMLPFIWLAYNGRYRWPLFLMTLVTSVVGIKIFPHYWNFYLINFLAGMSIISWGESTKRIPPRLFWVAVAALTISFYFVRPTYKLAVSETGDLFGFPWVNLVEVLLITPVVAAMFFNGERFSALAGRTFYFFGEASFSIYLIHWIIIVMVTNMMLGMWPVLDTQPKLFWIVLVVGVLAITIPLSWISHKWIELRGIEIGKLLAQRITEIDRAARKFG